MNSKVFVEESVKIAIIIAKGRRIAIAKQIEVLKPKGLVVEQIIRIIIKEFIMVFIKYSRESVKHFMVSIIHSIGFTTILMVVKDFITPVKCFIIGVAIMEFKVITMVSIVTTMIISRLINYTIIMVLAD